MIKKKCDRCGAVLGEDSRKTKQRFCGNCKRKFQLHWDHLPNWEQKGFRDSNLPGLEGSTNSKLEKKIVLDSKPSIPIDVLQTTNKIAKLQFSSSLLKYSENDWFNWLKKIHSKIYFTSRKMFPWESTKLPQVSQNQFVWFSSFIHFGNLLLRQLLQNNDIVMGICPFIWIRGKWDFHLFFLQIVCNWLILEKLMVKIVPEDFSTIPTLIALKVPEMRWENVK